MVEKVGMPLTVHKDAFCQFSSRFTTIAVINPPERKLTKRTSVQCALNKE